MATRLVELERNVFQGLGDSTLTVEPNWLTAPVELQRYRIPGGLTVIDVRSLLPDDEVGDRHMTDDRFAKRYVAIHHDAVAFKGADKDFDGETIDDDFDRLRANWRWHLDLGGMRTGNVAAPWSWGGTGYHLAVPPQTDVIYLMGALDTSRAHVSSGGTPMRDTQYAGLLPNHIGIGCVFLGNFADRRNDQTGEQVDARFDRPTQAALDRYQAFVEWLPGRLDRDLVAMPHKGAHPNHTSCPGDWIHRTARDTFSPQPEPADEHDHADALAKVRAAKALLADVEALLE